ncbi:MAG TPA: response regulator [Candidatus Angelobacter sp.]|jgi:two-component system response regulator|nr:response regulator [Candidatus Angelobacter sp.]
MEQEHMEILLVEDDPRDVRLTTRELQAGNTKIRIEVARDGAEALDFLFCQGDYSQRSSDRPPKLVLLDLKLPKVDGLQVLREIKSNPATQAIPVVVLTSSKEERDMVESYKLGVNSYIQKPVEFEKFRETIRTLGLYWLGVNQPPPDKTFAND